MTAQYVRVALALVVALLVVPRAAEAHQQGVSYSDVRVEATRVRYDLTVSVHDLHDVDADNDLRISPDEIVASYPRLREIFERFIGVQVDGERCPLRLENFDAGPEGTIVFHLRGPCHAGARARVEYGLLARSGGEGYNFAKIRFGDAFAEHVFSRNDTEVLLDGSTSVADTFRRFFVLGVEHIATGYDHILFLLALLIVGGGLRSLVGVVTAFTVAHSITLVLATLDVVTLPSRLVESAIALSIAWVAAENIVLDRQGGRWRITFAFGLVHGFGFASVLRDLHLPQQALAASLFAFNVGVEAGQVAVVVIAYPLIAAIQRSRHRRVIVATASAAILVVALYWFVERAFA